MPRNWTIYSNPMYSLNHLEIFFKRIKGINYDGVSMPVRHLNLHEISRFLIRFHEMGIKRVHLLGTSSFSTIVLCAYMANRYFDWISLDSTTWRKAAELGRYWNPDLTRRWMFDDGESNDEQISDCKCPVCFGRPFSEIKRLPSTEQAIILQVHNYWTIENLFASAFKYCRSLEGAGIFLNRSARMKDCLADYTNV